MNIKRVITASMLSVALLASAKTPRYIFYFIGDGMGMGHATVAQTFNRVTLGNSEPLTMMQFPVAGIVSTRSASSTVTDSAAGGTALATGSKTYNGAIGVNADTVPVLSVAEKLHNAGWGVGLVTTVAPDDATPAAFYAHVPSRRLTYDIGRQAAESGYEFIAGSNWRGFLDNGKETDLRDYMLSKGIRLTTSTDSAATASERRVFLYSDNPLYDGNAGYAIDSIPAQLKIVDMTKACMQHLQSVSPDRFFMMVEGGNIDHAAHGNDGSNVVVGTIEFNKALAEAYDFYLQHPDETLIIVTADHDTGGLTLGNRAVGYNSYMEKVPAQRMSKDMFSSKIKQKLNADVPPTWDEIKQFCAQSIGLWGPVKVNKEQEKALKALFDASMDKSKTLTDEKTLYNSYGALATELMAVLNTNLGFGWTSTGHTGNPVPLFAVGEGLQGLGGYIENTAIAPVLLKLAKVK